MACNTITCYDCFTYCFYIDYEPVTLSKDYVCKYSREQSEVDQVLYEAAEDQARAERVGLWRDPDPVPPWEWRRR